MLNIAMNNLGNIAIIIFFICLIIIMIIGLSLAIYFFIRFILSEFNEIKEWREYYEDKYEEKIKMIQNKEK